MKFHFISGLPRSGSTLLAAILRQNPRFHAGMTSPVASIFRSIETVTSLQNETAMFVSDEQRELFLRGIFSTYYEGKDGIIFDTSRMWCTRLPILFKLFPDSKMIVCVRELGWVLDSFERIYRKNHQRPSGIYNFDTNGTVYTRTMSLSASTGIVGYAFDAVREALASEYADKLLIIDYEKLCKQPARVLSDIYTFIGEKPFKHDFENVEYDEGEFDRRLGAPGLHKVKKKVEWQSRSTILPADLFGRFKDDNFWR